MEGARPRRSRGPHHLARPLPEQARHLPSRRRRPRTHVRRARHRRPHCLESTDPFQYVRDTTEKPYLAERGISMYTMQRAYFESRLYDEAHWKRYFDTLAADRINTFVVIFGYENGGFMAPLYPYFFDVKEFPDVEMVGITPPQQARNTAAFRTMIRLAHERGIEVTAGIWDHIYRGGVQGGGIPGASQNAGKRVPGLVWGVTAENLAPYTKAALRRFLEVFPEIDAIQFRMHDESGLKHERDPALLARRLRLHQGEPPQAAPRPARQGTARRSDRRRHRHGTQVEDQHQVLDGADGPALPSHAHQHRRPAQSPPQLCRPARAIRSATASTGSCGTAAPRACCCGAIRITCGASPSRRTLYDGDSFEVNEMLATKMLGEPHDAKVARHPQPRLPLLRLRVRALLAFLPAVRPPDLQSRDAGRSLAARIRQRVRRKAAARSTRRLQRASQVLPRIVAASYRYSNFPTTRGWAEMNRQGSLPEYAGEQGSDIQQFMNVRDEANSIIAGTDTAMRRPEETSRWFAKTADDILDAGRARGRRPAGKEFQHHRHRSEDSRRTGALSFASPAGRRLLQPLQGDGRPGVIRRGHRTREGRARGVGTDRDGRGRRLQRESRLRRARGRLQPPLERRAAIAGAQFRTVAGRAAEGRGQTGRKALFAAATSEAPPSVTLLPAKGLEISARVQSAAPLKSVRLRYRHATQYEDYQTAEMTLDPKTGIYTARIPASFPNPKWALMYFVEVVDEKGNGRIFPDLESATPYVVQLNEPHPKEPLRTRSGSYDPLVVATFADNVALQIASALAQSAVRHAADPHIDHRAGLARRRQFHLQVVLRQRDSRLRQRDGRERAPHHALAGRPDSSPPPGRAARDCAPCAPASEPAPPLGRRRARALGVGEHVQVGERQALR